ncbi:MAG TPA: response regulator transcription factor [Candidatus Thermoplasmatota archaeon]|nr:response regulator transcription factor [Candidatus Thermoplasmatota archaeon]
MARLLLVDDEPGFRLLAKMVLEEHPSFQVVGEAGDGKEAIEQARRLKPDAILLDLNMPVMGGLQALPKIRVASPDSLVFVVSVARDQQELHQAKMAGAHAFIDKALSNDHFVAAFKECLAAARDDWTEHRRDTFVPS